MLNKTIYDVNDIEGFSFFETITWFFSSVQLIINLYDYPGTPQALDPSGSERQLM